MILSVSPNIGASDPANADNPVTDLMDSWAYPNRGPRSSEKIRLLRDLAAKLDFEAGRYPADSEERKQLTFQATDARYQADEIYRNNG